MPTELHDNVSRQVIGTCLDVLLREPAAVYHAKSRGYLSSHQLTEFRRCPLLYFRKKIGLIPDEDRPAYLVGRAVHTLVLEGRARFNDEFAVGGPVNEKTGRPFGAGTKAFAEWAAARGRPVLTTEQAQLADWILASVMGHEMAAGLLADGVAEGVIRRDYLGVSSQARIDWFNPTRGGGIVDLKTCDDLDYFEADARRFGYAHQMAFYRAMLAGAMGVPPLDVPVHLIGVEKKEPFRCGVWRVGEEVLGNAQRENEAAIERLKICERSEVWPTGYESLRSFDWI